MTDSEGGSRRAELAPGLRRLGDTAPAIDPSAYIDPAAVVIGDVVVGADSSIWPGVVVRGDVQRIRIGAETNIQDGVMCHCTSPQDAHPGFPLTVGDRVTVGHAAILHGCAIDDEVLVGMRATIMDGAVVERGTLVGAGALVPPGKHLEGGYLYLGAPARRIRPLTDEESRNIIESAAHYVNVAARHKADSDA